MNEVKNNSPKRPVIFYYAIALVVLLALNFLLVPWTVSYTHLTLPTTSRV